MIEIRVLTPDDWQLWRELRLQALTEAPYAFGSKLTDWTGDGDREERWRARLSLAGSYNLAVIVDGEPAGIASGLPAEPAEPGIAELISMWVRPRARGRGAGDRLIESITQWARDRGERELRLMVIRDNSNAINLYRRNGFEPDEREDGAEMSMTKRLAATRATAP